MKISRYRDLTIIEDENKKLVIACDSSGGIGPKPLDVVQVDGYIVGRFLTRVVLMELISVGAQPIAVIDTLAVEMEPTGREIMKGILDELEQLKLNPNELLNGSTEDNVVVQQTGVGMTAIGECKQIFNNSYVNDLVICVGNPKVGNEVFLEDNEICTLPTIQHLRKLDGVHEIVPVGSKGVDFELNELVMRNKFMLERVSTTVNVLKSAGPVTCAVISLTSEAYERIIIEEIIQPIYQLGVLKEK